MQVVVLSAGRSGTNLVLECMTGHSYFIPTEYPEDKLLFKRDIQYPNRYLCKCDTVYIPSYKHLYSFMKNNRSACILWSFRNPRNWVLSKLYRGRIGNSGRVKPADDATIDGCKQDMQWMFQLLQSVERDFPLRIIRVKMEDIILDIEKECKRICKFLCIPYQEEMTRPWERMRHKGKKERYGNKLDTSQINLYENIDTIYNGYFLNKKKEVEELFKYIHPLLKEFGYTEEKE